jgi:formylmethanofuran dehydrogenase subunit E
MDENMTTEALTRKAVAFHGHLCPGLAIGIRAAEIALREIGASALDEEVVAVVETDMCGVDAVQALTGCTFGKGNFVHKDYGKKAFSFYRRGDGKGIRIVTLPGVLPPRDSEREELFDKMRAGALAPEERKRFGELQIILSQKILDAPLEELFEIKAALPGVPEQAKIQRSAACARCKEEVMETRLREVDGMKVCVPCSERS